MAKLVQVIYNQEYRGKGTEEDPGRLVDQWFQPDGTLLFERDHVADDSAIKWADRFWKLGGDVLDVLDKALFDDPQPDHTAFNNLRKHLFKWRKP